jgi:hypothetical protein
MHVKENYVIFIHLFDSGILLIIDLNKKKELLLHLSIFYEYQKFFQHCICFSIQLQLQFVNLHRNQRYFIIKLHTWFCLSYFLETNIKCYCIYQYFMSINISKYLRFLCKFTSWSGETPTGNFSDVFLFWTRIMSVLIGWPI